MDIPSGDDADAKKIRAAILRPSRNKKTSEVSEEEVESVDESNIKQKNRETRSKKISERSDDTTEESPAPPPLRNTRRRGKLDDSSNERDDIAENKRLSRIKGILCCYLYILKRFRTTYFTWFFWKKFDDNFFHG